MNEIKREDTFNLKVSRVGNSLGVILPEELLSRLGLGEGDLIQIVEEPGHGFKLSGSDSVHVRGMEIARNAFKVYASTFRALAK
jgi:putative addiction module antidote